MCDIGADQRTDTRAYAAEAAKGDKPGRPFHHPLDILQCFERLLGGSLSVALNCHKSTLNNKVTMDFSSFKVFCRKNFAPLAKALKTRRARGTSQKRQGWGGWPPPRGPGMDKGPRQRA